MARPSTELAHRLIHPAMTSKPKHEASVPRTWTNPRNSGCGSTILGQVQRPVSEGYPAGCGIPEMPLVGLGSPNEAGQVVHVHIHTRPLAQPDSSPTDQRCQRARSDVCFQNEGSRKNFHDTNSQWPSRRLSHRLGREASEQLDVWMNDTCSKQLALRSNASVPYNNPTDAPPGKPFVTYRVPRHGFQHRTL